MIWPIFEAIFFVCVIFYELKPRKNCFWDFLTFKDQIAWNKKGGTYNDNCNMHSWHIEKPCCYSSDHRNKNCMWKAFERLVGWSIGNIYEVSAMNTRRNYNFDMAMEQWKGSSKVLRWALFYDLVISKKFENCSAFSIKISTSPEQFFLTIG